MLPLSLPRALPVGSLPSGPPQALPGSGTRVLGQGPAVALVCCVSPEPEQNVTMNTNRVGAAVFICSVSAAPGSRGNKLSFLAVFLLRFFSPHTHFVQH